jgi:hypothetical protein
MRNPIIERITVYAGRNTLATPERSIRKVIAIPETTIPQYIKKILHNTVISDAITPTRRRPKLQTTIVNMGVSKKPLYSEKFTSQATNNPQMIRNIHND